MKKMQNVWILEYRESFIGALREAGIVYSNGKFKTRLAYLETLDKSLTTIDRISAEAAYLLVFYAEKNPHRLRCHGSSCKILENRVNLQSKTQEELTELYNRIKEKARPFKLGEHYYLEPPYY